MIRFVGHCCAVLASTTVMSLSGMTQVSAQSSDVTLTARVMHVLTQTPLIDGHNDLPWEVRARFGNAGGVDLRSSTAHLPLKLEDGEIRRR